MKQVYKRKVVVDFVIQECSIYGDMFSALTVTVPSDDTMIVNIERTKVWDTLLSFACAEIGQATEDTEMITGSANSLPFGYDLKALPLCYPVFFIPVCVRVIHNY